MSDLAVFSDPSSLELAGDPAARIIVACGRAKEWLSQLVDNNDLEQIAVFKGQAEALRAYSIAMQLGKDAEVAARDMIMRTTRCMTEVVRKGQEAGEIRSSGGDNRAEVPRDTSAPAPVSPAAFYASKREMVDSYAMTDDVSEDDFEVILEEAKAEGNLTRRNVAAKATKLKRQRQRNSEPIVIDRSSAATKARVERIVEMAEAGNRSSQIAEKIGLSEERVRELARTFGITLPDAIIGRRPRIDPNRVVNETVIALEGLVMGLGLHLVDGHHRSRAARSTRDVPLAVVSPVAQRKLNRARVDHLLANLDLEQLGTPTVSDRDDAFYIIDGQHRIEALRDFGFGDQSLQCWTYEGLTEQQEADKFDQLNDVLAVHAFDRYSTRVAAGRDVETDIDRIVRSAGLVVSRDAVPGAISAVGTLSRVYRRSDGKTLGRALRIARDAFGDPGLEAAVIDGLGYLCQRYNGQLEDGDVATKLAQINGGVNGLLGKAETLRRSTGSYKSHCVAAAAVEIINSGKGGKKLPSWWKATA